MFSPKVHLSLFTSCIRHHWLLPLAPQGQLRVLCSLKSHQSEILTGGGTDKRAWEPLQAGLTKKATWREGCSLTWNFPCLWSSRDQGRVFCKPHSEDGCQGGRCLGTGQWVTTAVCSILVTGDTNLSHAGGDGKYQTRELRDPGARPWLCLRDSLGSPGGDTSHLRASVPLAVKGGTG